MTDAERQAREAVSPTEAVPSPGIESPAAAAASDPPSHPMTPPLASVIARPASSSGRGTSLLLLLAGAIAVGGLAFAGGRLTAPATTVTRPGSGQLPGGGQLNGSGQGFPGRGDGIGGGITLAGTVTAVSADSITIELASGSSMTIPLDADTEYHAATATTPDAVTVGSEVTVSPGGRTANPGASLDPNASPGAGAGISFGAATDVTIVEP